jgi:adenylate cyclase
MQEVPEPGAHEVRAIMFTALALSGARAPGDEAQECALREEQGRLVRELLPRQGGREVKMLEEGFLLEFDRALSAVCFGLALQEAVAERNRRAPTQRRLELRIGAHLGPVVHQDGDVFGEGVNLAARIESLAQPGALYVSETVAREVEGQALPRAVRLGRSRLKKIRLPVGVFHVAPPSQASRPALLSRVRSLFMQLRLGS